MSTLSAVLVGVVIGLIVTMLIDWVIEKTRRRHRPALQLMQRVKIEGRDYISVAVSADSKGSASIHYELFDTYLERVTHGG